MKELIEGLRNKVRYLVSFDDEPKKSEFLPVCHALFEDLDTLEAAYDRLVEAYGLDKNPEEGDHV